MSICGLIAFVLFGWIFCETRAATLVLLMLIVFAWYGLGPLLGRGDLIGYCPVTDLHWRVRSKLGLKRPDGGYIQYLAARLSSGELENVLTEKSIVRIFFACLASAFAATLLFGLGC